MSQPWRTNLGSPAGNSGRHQEHSDVCAPTPAALPHVYVHPVRAEVCHAVCIPKSGLALRSSKSGNKLQAVGAHGQYQNAELHVGVVSIPFQPSHICESSLPGGQRCNCRRCWCRSDGKQLPTLHIARPRAKLTRRKIRTSRLNMQIF